VIGGLDAEAMATVLAIAELRLQAKRPGLPVSRGLALEAGARRRRVGIMRDAVHGEKKGECKVGCDRSDLSGEKEPHPS
jgi:hypothetical protein